MPRLEPPVTELTEPFWAATREERLLLQWCRACEQAIFYPRDVCPGCLGDELEWREASGLATVHAVSVQHRGPLGEEPYAVALVELAEGVRMMTNVVGCPPEGVGIGDAVRLSWEPLSDGRNLPVFTPTEA